MLKPGSPKVGMFDFLTVLVVFFLCIALLETPNATPPKITTFGTYAITATWRPGSNDDVDLWVQDPAGNICYFANTNAGLMHLEHDDLGTATSGTQVLPNGHTVRVLFNGERTVLTGYTPGEYIVNVHMFIKRDSRPTTVVVQLWELRGHDHIVHTQSIVLQTSGQEETAFRFTLDAAGNVTNVNRLPKKFVGAPGTPPPTVLPGTGVR